VFQDCTTTGYVGYCEIYCNHNDQGLTPTDYGAVTWRVSAITGNYTVEYCYISQAYCDVFSGISGNFNVTIQFNLIYDNGIGNSLLVSPAPGSHPDCTQFQEVGTVKMWNNCLYLPKTVNYGTQGFMTNNAVYPSMTCQNVVSTPASTAFSISLSGTYGTGQKFLFHNNYLDHNNYGYDIYPGYNAAATDLGTPNGNILMVTGATFS
jgi:hypothetical protein